ncbi:MAG: hypothetical protein ACC628_15150 [Pirellulaceae bacterium]
MNKNRQTILLAVFGLVIAYFVGEWLFQTVLDGPKKKLLSRARRLEKQIRKGEKELEAAIKAGKRLEVWESQSLPSNSEIAVSLYGSWLTELIEFSGFDKANVDAGTPMKRKGLYELLDFSIRAKGTLNQLTTFLFEFYNSGHLHQIRSINLSPLPRGDQLDLAISIEALILPSADRTDQLTSVRADRLAFSDLADYQIIADRNLFGIAGRGIYQTDHTFLTAVVTVNDQPQAWFTDRFTDRVFKLSRGHRISVGQFQGEVQQIEGHDVIVDSDGERWLITVGESLAQAMALPPEF